MKEDKEKKLLDEIRRAVRTQKQALASIDKWLVGLQGEIHDMTLKQKLALLEELKALYETLVKAQKGLPRV